MNKIGNNVVACRSDERDRRRLNVAICVSLVPGYHRPKDTVHTVHTASAIYVITLQFSYVYSTTDGAGSTVLYLNGLHSKE